MSTWIKTSGPMRARHLAEGAYSIENDDWSGRLDTGASTFPLTNVLREIGRAGPKRLLVREDGGIAGIGYGYPAIHPVMRMVMRAMEIDVDAVRIWAASPLVWRAADVSGETCDGAVFITDDGRVKMFVNYTDLGWGVVHDDIVIDRRIPETSLPAAVGRRLCDVASIPDLDHLDIHVIEARNEDGLLRLRVVPDQGYDQIA